MARTPTFMYDDGPAELRHELRALIADRLPADWVGPFTEDPRDQAISDEFCVELARRGLLVPEWPVEYGGQGMPLDHGIVIREEMWAYGEPRGARYYGPNWIGPSIIEHGTPEQKALHLPAIAEGSAIWCQGFSEPDAGSDLAALRTRAEPDGDGFRITGQKIWTSWAGWADWCYLLARVPTESDDPRAGITVFLLPMSRDGILVRPIDGLPGAQHFKEVFLDNVRAERSEILGEVGGGWRVIRAALSHERVGIARYARSDRLLALVEPRVRSTGGEVMEQRWLEARVANRVSRLVCRRTLDSQGAEGALDFEASAARLLTTRADQVAADVASDALGDEFFDDRDSPHAPFGGLAELAWRYSQGATIASGTTEMLQTRLVSALRKGRRLDTPSEAAELSDAVQHLVGPVAGLPAMRAALDDPDTRLPLRDAFAEMLEGLDAALDFESALQAAEACRRAGAALLPLPVEAMVLAEDGKPPLVLTGAAGSIEHGDLFPEWIALRDEGPRRVAGLAAPLGAPLGAFVCRPGEPLDGGPADASTSRRSLALVLPAYYVLGALETALELAVRYAGDRVQFSRPIIEFQAVGFRLADTVAELYGLQSLAQFTLWRAVEHPHESMVDALALRWHAVDVARRSLRACQQVFGAIGLTYEHDLALIVAGLQPRLRMPWTQPETFDRFRRAVRSRGFSSTFSAAAHSTTEAPIRG